MQKWSRHIPLNIITRAGFTRTGIAYSVNSYTKQRIGINEEFDHSKNHAADDAKTSVLDQHHSLQLETQHLVINLFL